MVETPEPLRELSTDPQTFPLALRVQMERHGDTLWHLHRAIVTSDDRFNVTTLRSWCRGDKLPRSVESLEILRCIEARYRLQSGYFKRKLPHPGRAATGHQPVAVAPSERRRLAWHLPDDFEWRPRKEQEEILNWVRTVVVSGSTQYRRYQAAAAKQRYAVRFRELPLTLTPEAKEDPGDEPQENAVVEPDLVCSVVDAPPRLAREMASLIRFKTRTLTEVGYRRHGVWGEETASQKLEHLGLMFGALAASPRSAVRGFGVALGRICFAMLLFPAVWDWYLQWREARRGFYTAWEVDMLRIALALTRRDTGWIRQTPALGNALVPVSGLISQTEIERVRGDWQLACDRLHEHAAMRADEIRRVARGGNFIRHHPNTFLRPQASRQPWTLV